VPVDGGAVIIERLSPPAGDRASGLEESARDRNPSATRQNALAPRRLVPTGGQGSSFSW